MSHQAIEEHAARAQAEIRKLTAQKWIEIVLKFQFWNRSDGQRKRYSKQGDRK